MAGTATALAQRVVRGSVQAKEAKLLVFTVVCSYLPADDLQQWQKVKE